MLFNPKISFAELIPAFLLICYSDGAPSGSLHFRNVYTCDAYKKVLHQQTFKRNKKESSYQCVCKLVPSVDTEKVQVF